jgi:hypothetical protein
MVAMIDAETATRASSEENGAQKSPLGWLRKVWPNPKLAPAADDEDRDRLV